MVISQWGVADIPKMILGVAFVELIKLPPLIHLEGKIYQRQIVVYALAITQVTFIMLQYFYVEALEWDTWALPFGLFSQKWKKTAAMVTYILVEVLAAYNIDGYWLLLEEKCNIQQAKTVFRVVNNGQVGALFIIGMFVGYVPWSFYMTAASLMSITAFVFLPCQVLIPLVISPYDQKTAANAEKDRGWARDKAAKEKNRRKKAHAKAALKGGHAEQMTEDFDETGVDQGIIGTVKNLLLDPMIPYMAITCGLMFGFDAIYQWQVQIVSYK